MSKTYIPEGYHSELTLYETQNAIGVIHHAFEEHLGQTLNLKRVSAPLFVDPHTGLNDNLSGVERPVPRPQAQKIPRRTRRGISCCYAS